MFTLVHIASLIFWEEILSNYYSAAAASVRPFNSLNDIHLRVIWVGLAWHVSLDVLTSFLYNDLT